MLTQAPNINDVEITLVGTGGGYGESIIIKIGKDKWIVIDSCINPDTKEPLALEYLEQVNADFNNVILVVCTHWHNDHIKGLSKLLQKCPNCEFSFSAVNDLDKFLLLCELDYQKTLKGSKSSTNEFANCLQVINDRGSYFTKAQSNLLLAKVDENSCLFELYALSPSPKTIKDFDGEISQLITDFGTRNTAIVNKSPNDKSVALLLKFKDERVLLGADLEIGKNEHEGWWHILKYSKIVDAKKSNLYKIPHHGSENGYTKEIFELLVNDNGILKGTPYKSSGLPTIPMLEKYSIHSKDIYLTSSINTSKKPKKRDKSIEKIINRTVNKISEVKFSHGIVRSRLDYSIEGAEWNSEIFLAAIKLDCSKL